MYPFVITIDLVTINIKSLIMDVRDHCQNIFAHMENNKLGNLRKFTQFTVCLLFVCSFVLLVSLFFRAFYFRYHLYILSFSVTIAYLLYLNFCLFFLLMYNLVIVI